ncbi:MAG: hypothetical protein KF852_06070 [Saprospiraceae bacterium]|nr:hypothetical protein [Saprospiraceae bacterium]
MKNLNRFFAISALALVAVVGQSFTSKSSRLPIIVPAGLEVSLESGIDFNSEVVEPGHTVDFFVRNNVTVNNHVVISAGSTASGEITRVTKADPSCRSCENGCASIQIVVKSVQAVDGSNVKLRSTPINIKASRPGVPAQLNIGHRFSAYTLSNTRVSL